MLTREVISHVTHWRLKLGPLSLASRKHLRLIAFFYDIQCRNDPERLFVKMKVPQNLPRQSLRSLPAIFEYEAHLEHTNGMPPSQSWASGWQIDYPQRISTWQGSRSSRLGLIMFSSLLNSKLGEITSTWRCWSMALVQLNSHALLCLL